MVHTAFDLVRGLPAVPACGDHPDFLRQVLELGSNFQVEGGVVSTYMISLDKSITFAAYEVKWQLLRLAYILHLLLSHASGAKVILSVGFYCSSLVQGLFLITKCRLVSSSGFQFVLKCNIFTLVKSSPKHGPDKNCLSLDIFRHRPRSQPANATGFNHLAIFNLTRLKVDQVSNVVLFPDWLIRGG